MYKPNSFLNKAIESGNIDKIRGALVGIIQSDPGFRTKEFDNALEYVKGKGFQVFEEQPDHNLLMNETEYEWNQKYFATALTYLRNNFTEARLKHIIRVGKETHREVGNALYENDIQDKGEKDLGKKPRGHQTAAVVLVIVLVAVIVLLLLKRTNPNG